ncbi:Di-sulfide bridge nucleocytoplasmic transport domain-containing protein [Dipodascopsis uninucleata]
MMMDIDHASPSTGGDGTGIYRGHESPMDFTYHSNGEALLAASPFAAAAAAAVAASAYSTPAPNRRQQQQQQQQLQNTRASSFYSPRSGFTDLNSINYRLATNTPIAPQSPLQGRGPQRMMSENLSSNINDNDIEMTSSPITPAVNDENASPRTDKACDRVNREIVKTDDKTPSKISSEQTTSGSLNKVANFFKSSPVSLSRTRNFLTFPKRTASNKKSNRYVIESDGEEGDDTTNSVIDLDSDDSDAGWERQIIVKKTTMLRSPRKSSGPLRAISSSESPRKRSSSALKEAVSKPSTLTLLSRHENLPFVFASYLQLFFNMFLVFIILYLIVSFVLTIRSDIANKVEEYTSEVISEMAQCSREYLANRCMPDTRVPMMAQACEELERCMNKDPYAGGRARVSAETVAEIINSFIEPISYKTMLFILLLIFGSLYVSSSKVMPAPVPVLRSVSQGSQTHHDQLVYHSMPPLSPDSENTVDKTDSRSRSTSRLRIRDKNKRGGR